MGVAPNRPAPLAALQTSSRFGAFSAGVSIRSRPCRSLAASVFEHAARTIDRSLPVGAHGLPLMGTGDWNDGMNRVWHEGRDESVWVALFLCAAVRDWIPLARERGEHERAMRWEAALAGWSQALETEAWDGVWYRRASARPWSPPRSTCSAPTQACSSCSRHR